MKFSISTLVFLASAALVAAAPTPDPQTFISNPALKKGGVPCNKAAGQGDNCHPGAVANPPVRGCSEITGCRGGAAPAAPAGKAQTGSKRDILEAVEEETSDFA